MPHDKVDEETAECPMALDDIDLFEPGAQKFWYESYEILHKESPVHPLPSYSAQCLAECDKTDALTYR